MAGKINQAAEGYGTGLGQQADSIKVRELKEIVNGQERSVMDVADVSKQFEDLIDAKSGIEDMRKQLQLLIKEYGAYSKQAIEQNNLIAKTAEENAKKVAKATIAANDNAYANASLAEKARIKEQTISVREKLLEKSKMEREADEADARVRIQDAKALEAELQKIRNRYAAEDNRQKELIRQDSAKKEKLEQESKLASADNAVKRIELRSQMAQKKAGDDQEAYRQAVANKSETLTSMRASGASDEDISRREAELDADIAQKKQAASVSNMASIRAQLIANVVKQGVQQISEAIKKLGDTVDNNLKTITSSQSRYLTRLTGLRDNVAYYAGLTKQIAMSFATSPYMTQEKFYENMMRVVDAGIAYNIEQRAYLATLSDKVAATFDALDPTLQRLVRLQQADSTLEMLGIERELTGFLNTMFRDTSYLSNIHDTVSAAIVDANSMLSKQGATELEFTIQKWLGSLYSVGLSDSAVSAIAQGLNYLATGNVEAFSSNESLQSLFAMSASRSQGKDFAQLLTDGLDASETNLLMKSMVEYLREIADTGNNVVRAAYGGVFGIGMGDLQAIRNLGASNIASIFNKTLTAEQARGAAQAGISSIWLRMSIGEMVQNLVDNVLFSTTADIYSNPLKYVPYLLAQASEKITGGLHLPTFSFKGNFVDLSSFTFEGLAKAGIAGMSLLTQMPNIISSLTSSRTMGMTGYLPFFEHYARTPRGTYTGSPTYSTGITSGTSMSEYIGTGSESDYRAATLAGAADQAEKDAAITNKSLANQEKTLDDLYKSLFTTKESLNVNVKDFSKELQDAMGKVLEEIVRRALYGATDTDNSQLSIPGQVDRIVAEMPSAGFYTGAPDVNRGVGGY